MRIDVNGMELEVADEGSGPAVLLLHGFPDTHELWRHQVPALTGAGFRTIAPDLRGFGGSERPAEARRRTGWPTTSPTWSVCWTGSGWTGRTSSGTTGGRRSGGCSRPWYPTGSPA